MAKYTNNKGTNQNTPSSSPGKGGSTMNEGNLKLIAKKFKNKTSKFIDKVPNNSTRTVNLFNTFGRAEDNIEFNVYDTTNALVSHTRDFKKYIFTEEGKQIDGTSNEIIVNPEQDLRDLNFNSGQYKVEYRFQRRKIIDSFLKAFSIKEISNSRREIRIDTLELDNIQLEQRYNIFNEELNQSSFLKDFTLNFGDGVNITAVNIFLDKSDDNYSLLIKLLDPLPLTIANTFTLRIVEDLIEPATLDLNLEISSLEDQNIQIAGPNFKIDTRLNSSIPSTFKTYDEILGGGVSSSYENLLNALSSSFEPSVEYDNLVTDSGYHFENFVHFSSATERLNNFKYKLSLIEFYDKQLANINTITGNASSSVVTLSSIKTIEDKKKKVIGGLDGYERFLYFESGTYSWPKEPLAGVVRPYTQLHTTSSQGLEWLGSNDGASDYYGGQIYSASQFDDQNIYNLNKLIPEYIKNDSNNDQYKLFVDMIGQHFDQSWLYIKSLTENKKAENKLTRGIDKDLVYNALKGLGIQVFDEFENEDLFGYLIGANKDDTVLYNTGSEDARLITVSDPETGFRFSLPRADITKEKWKRIYHNLPYLLKTKGTERGIRALITSYGIPSTILNVKEFGGSTTDNTTFKTFTHDTFSYAFDARVGPHASMIKTNWSSSLTMALSASAKTIEFQVQPNRGYSSNNDKYHLFSFQVGEPGSVVSELALVLDPYTGEDIEEFNDADTYARLYLYLASSIVATTPYFPAYNGDFWNIHLSTNGASGSNSTLKFGAYQANHLKNINKYTSSYSITETLNTTNFGNHHDISGVSNLNNGGAKHAYFCGTSDSTGGATWPTMRYSGSLREVRIYYGEQLTDSTLEKHALNPFMYSGNTPTSSYNSLVLRLPLGSNLQQDSQSYHPNINVDYLGSTVESSAGSILSRFISRVETHHLSTPDTVGKSMTSEKVRLDSGEVEDNILSPDIKTETSVLDRQPTDSPDLGVYFSPSYEINKDIIYQLGSFRLDDYIGDPTHISENNYPDLKDLSNEYFKKPMDRFKYTDFIDITKQFDHTLFKMIESMVPAKVNLKTGILIEPHYLERSKFGNPSTLPGVEKHNNFEATYDLDPNSSTSDFNLTGENILTEVTYNVKPESEYLSFDATALPLFNNVTSGRKSKKYFRTTKIKA